MLNMLFQDAGVHDSIESIQIFCHSLAIQTSPIHVCTLQRLLEMVQQKLSI